MASVRQNLGVMTKKDESTVQKSASELHWAKLSDATNFLINCFACRIGGKSIGVSMTEKKTGLSEYRKCISQSWAINTLHKMITWILEDRTFDPITQIPPIIKCGFASQLVKQNGSSSSRRAFLIKTRRLYSAELWHSSSGGNVFNQVAFLNPYRNSRLIDYLATCIDGRISDIV